MNKTNTMYKPLASKIISHFLILEITIFACIIASLFLFLFPFMIRSAYNKYDYIATSSINHLDNQLDNLDSFFLVISQNQIIKDLTDQYLNGVDQHSCKAKISLYLNEFVTSNPYCRYIYIELPNGDSFSSISNMQPNDYDVLNSESYKSLQKGLRHSWISEIYKNGNKISHPGYSMACCKLQTIAGTSVIITIFTDVTLQIEALQDLTPNIFSNLALYDYYGNLLYDIEETKHDPFADDAEHNYSANILKNGYYTTAIGNNYFCTFIGYAAPKLLLQDFIMYFIVILLITVISFIVTIRVFLPILNKNLIEQNQLRFSLIISQISPHFIFNTMNIISVLARQNRCDEVVKINTALTKLLRDRLRINETEFLDTVKHEIEITQEYIEIMKFRVEMDVDFCWEIPEELYELEIPKNILQPLIENALLHGLYDAETSTIKGMINIVFAKIENYICIEVTDNGRGIIQKNIDEFYTPPKNQEAHTRGQHIGLKNICDRLELIYPRKNATLDIYNISPHGAKISIKLPLSTKIKTIP